MEALRSAGKSLSEADQWELLRFLGQSGAVEGLGVESVRWLKNDVMNLLCAQEKPVPELAEALVRICRDNSQDAVIRDYAIQHLGFWYASELDPGRRTEIEHTLWDAVGERDGTIGGTALIALSEAAHSGKLEPGAGERLSAVALATAGDSGAAAAARVTALQVCAQRGVADALPLARDLVHGDGDMSLRISAVAALGRLGGTNDLTLLRALAGGTEARLRPAARTALAQLQAGRRGPGTGAPAGN
jgi:hypothetical protein